MVTAYKLAIELLPRLVKCLADNWFAFVVGLVAALMFKIHILADQNERHKIKVEADSIAAEYNMKVAAYEERERQRVMLETRLQDSIAKATKMRRIKEAEFKSKIALLEMKVPDTLKILVSEVSEKHNEVIQEYQAQLIASAQLLMNEKSRVADLEDRVNNAEGINEVLRKKIDEMSAPPKKRSLLTDMAIVTVGVGLGLGLRSVLQ